MKNGKMINYIFGSLYDSEKAIKTMLKTLKGQERFNKLVCVSISALTIHAVMSHKIINEQNAKINKLNRKLNELNNDIEVTNIE